MRPSKMLTRLSLRLLKSRSSSVVPFPIQSPFNQQLTSQLKTLLSLIGSDRLTVSFVAHALDASVATQKLAHTCLPKSISDREAVECYLDDDSVCLLDACKGLGDKLDHVHTYVERVRLALHLLGGGRFRPTSTAVARADELLEACQSMERECSRKMMTRSTSSHFKKLSNKKLSSELEEILDGSSITTSTMCEILDTALSFKPKHYNVRSSSPASTSYTWLSSLQELRNNVKKDSKKSVIWELQNTVLLVQELRQGLKCEADDYTDKLRVRVEELKRSCDVVDKGLQPLEGKVKELYRYLMCFRMALLGNLSSMP